MRKYVSDEERKGLSSIGVALINEYLAEPIISRPEQQAEALLHKAFVCLRVIRPTRSRFRAIKYKKVEEGKVDIFSFTHPDSRDVAMPACEILNRISVGDLRALRELLPAFLHQFEMGPRNLTRAIFYLEQGYAEIWHPAFQLQIWCSGIEAVFSDGQDLLETSDLIQRIGRLVPLDSDIYAEMPDRDLYAVRPLALEETISDLFRLRNIFVHGGWIPDEWKDKSEKYGRRTVGDEPLGYADILREVASFVLRKLIIRRLKTLSS